MTIMWATEATDNLFIIREVDVINPGPFGTSTVNFQGVRLNAYSKQTAWTLAQRQDTPVRVVPIEGPVKHLGCVFNPRAFEQAAYSGYVSRGIGDTDGYYAPISFDHWVVQFRKNPEYHLDGGNTEFRPSQGSRMMYLGLLAQLVSTN